MKRHTDIRTVRTLSISDLANVRGGDGATVDLIGSKTKSADKQAKLVDQFIRG